MPTYDEQLYEQTLEEGRNEDKKRFTLSIFKRVAQKLNEMIETGHATSAFFILFSLAILKDGAMDWVLDFFAIGEIPILGQLPGYVVTGIMTYFAWSKSGCFKNFYRKRIILLIVDLLPFAINNLPLTTAGIFWMWWDVRKKAAAAEINLEDLNQKTEEELETIDQEMNWTTEQISEHNP
ncbi:MAG: hypothetical protein V1845_00010 [bacterium]